MSYWQLFYHIVFATKDRRPLLTHPSNLLSTACCAKRRSASKPSVFALNGTEDHMHVVAAIPPNVAVATFVGQIKALSATRFNKSATASQWPFFWQNEYGVVSFDHKKLPLIVAYVEQQKEHHKTQTLIRALERVAEGGVGMLPMSAGDEHGRP